MTRNPILTSWLLPKELIICEPETVGEEIYQGPMIVGQRIGSIQ